VDPEVSQAKFAREIAEYRELEAEYRRRGWLLLEAEFPHVVVALCAPQLKPPAVIVGVSLDYSNYDVEPPAVTFVDPFTSDAYLAKDLPTVLKRSVPAQNFAAPPGMEFPLGAQPMFVAQQPLLQARDPDDIPFLCIAGVHKYGVEPISEYQIELSMNVTGLIQSSVPE
jgi:hypothetical protein